MQLASRVSLHQSKLSRNVIGISYRQGNALRVHVACVSYGSTSFASPALAGTPCDGRQLADERDHQAPLDSTRVGSKNARVPVIKAIHPASPLNSEATVSRKMAARRIKCSWPVFVFRQNMP